MIGVPVCLSAGALLAVHACKMWAATHRPALEQAVGAHLAAVGTTAPALEGGSTDGGGGKSEGPLPGAV